MKLKEYNLLQVSESLSNENRYYFWQKYGREAFSDEELIHYYVFAGGAEHFAQQHRKELEDVKKKTV